VANFHVGSDAGSPCLAVPDLGGIWEIRGGRRHFVFSKLMAWLAVDCGLRIMDLTPELAQEPGLREP
jgi:hypothetical protein